MKQDVEALARPEVRRRLSLRQLMRLYLDPFALFKSVTAGKAEALRYNQRHRGMLLVYARRWAVIAIVCLLGAMPLGALARAEPVLFVPFLGLDLGFAVAVCALLLSVAMYFLLGRHDLE